MMKITKTPDIERWRRTATLSPLEIRIALWQEGFVSQQEALADAENNVMPPAVLYAISSLSPESQAVARVVWAKSIEISRLHPTVLLVAEAFQQTPEQIDQIFKIYKGTDLTHG